MEGPLITILLVEDDPIHRKLIKGQLHDFDKSIVIEHVNTAEESFICLEKSIGYDFIILNYDLPQKNGLDALRNIRKKYNFKGPVVMLIDYKNEAVAIDALREGASNCIIKTEDYISRLPMVIEECLKKLPKVHERVILEYRPKEELIPFTLDEQPVVGHTDETVLDVAKRYGIYIPTLCYYPSVSRLGACRICLVEVTLGKVTRLYPSCMYPINEGIIVKTSTEEVINTRRMIMELLLARCPESEILKDMAKEMGIEKSRFRPRDNPDNCILCGLCVRVCAEVVRANAISFLNRGIHRKIGTPFLELSGTCTGCGECAKVCPTDAITLEYIDENFRKKRQTRMAAKCDGCSGYNNRACVNNCPTGALKVISVNDFITKNKGSINVELRELLKYSLEEEAVEEKNA